MNTYQSRYPWTTKLGPRGLKVILRADGTPITMPALARPAPVTMAPSAAAPAPWRPLPEEPCIEEQYARRQAALRGGASAGLGRPSAPLPAPVAAYTRQPPTGEQIAAWRKAAGLSQRDLAYKLDISRGLMAGIESDQRRAPDARRRAAALLGHPEYAEVVK